PAVTRHRSGLARWGWRAASTAISAATSCSSPSTGCSFPPPPIGQSGSLRERRSTGKRRRMDTAGWRARPGTGRHDRVSFARSESGKERSRGQAFPVAAEAKERGQGMDGLDLQRILQPDLKRLEPLRLADALEAWLAEGAEGGAS